MPDACHPAKTFFSAPFEKFGNAYRLERIDRDDALQSYGKSFSGGQWLSAKRTLTRRPPPVPGWNGFWTVLIFACQCPYVFCHGLITGTRALS